MPRNIPVFESDQITQCAALKPTPGERYDIFPAAEAPRTTGMEIKLLDSCVEGVHVSTHDLSGRRRSSSTVIL